MNSNVIMIPASESKPDTLRVAAYCRVSSDSSDQLHSYAAQIRKYTEEIGHHEGWELVPYPDWHSDGQAGGLQPYAF